MFAKNSVINFANSFFANASLFLTNVCLARFLGSDEYAVMVLLMNIVGTFVIFSNFGVTDAVTKFVAETSDKVKIGKLVSSSGFAFFLFITGGALLLVASAGYLSKLFFGGGNTLYIRLSASWMLFVSIVLFARSVGMGLHRMSIVIIGDLVHNPTRLLYVIALLLFGVSVGNIVVGWTIISIAGSLGLLVYFYYFIRRLGICFYLPSTKEIKKILSYSIYLYMPFLSVYMIKHVLTLQLGAFSSNDEVSFFSVSMSLVTVSFLVFVPVAKILMPTISRIYDLKEYPKMEVIAKILSKYIGAISILIAAFFCFYSKMALGFIYGNMYLQAAPVLVVLSLAIFFETLKFFTDPFLSGTQHAKTLSVIEIIRLFAMTLGGFFVIPAYGALGAAIVFLVTAAFGCGLKIVMLERMLKLNLFAETIKIISLFVILIVALVLQVNFFVFLITEIMLILLLKLVSFKEIKTITKLLMS
ncbi:MAG: oligosaccharide flippase family protein [Candidatus Omnitrophica bacterium]|nr:oligosaccharide flippase family protein [Candidatus Omnitrophota bacterium]